MSEVSMNTTTIGSIGEYAIISDLLLQGVEVFKTCSDTENTDLVCYHNGTFKRMQIKTVTKLKTRSSVEIKMHKHIKNADHIDYLGVYLTEDKICAYVPYNGEGSIMLALRRAKNCQNKKRKWFYEYMEYV